MTPHEDTVQGFNYCRVSGNRQFPLLKQGKTTQKQNSINMVKQKLLQGFLGMLRPGLATILGYLCSFMKFLTLFAQTHYGFLVDFCETPIFGVKTRQALYLPEYPLLIQRKLVRSRLQTLLIQISCLFKLLSMVPADQLVVHQLIRFFFQFEQLSPLCTSEGYF